MRMLTENKEIIYKSLIVIGGISLFIGLGSYMSDYYIHYKKIKKSQEDYNKKLKKCQEDFYKNDENNLNNENNENNENNLNNENNENNLNNENNENNLNNENNENK